MHGVVGHHVSLTFSSLKVLSSNLGAITFFFCCSANSRCSAATVHGTGLKQCEGFYKVGVKLEAAPERARLLSHGGTGGQSAHCVARSAGLPDALEHLSSSWIPRCKRCCVVGRWHGPEALLARRRQRPVRAVQLCADNSEASLAKMIGLYVSRAGSPVCCQSAQASQSK